MRHLVRSSVLALLLPGVCAAQSLPSVALDRNQYVLTIPYLEFGTGTAKQAYGVVLRSSDLNTFVLDGTSVTIPALLGATTDSPTVGRLNAGYRLVVPRLRYGTQHYSVAFTTTDLSRFVVDAPTVAEAPPPSTLNGPTAVVIANVGERTVGTSRFSSAGQLAVSWRAPTGYVVDHYEITAAESVFGTSPTTAVAATETSTTMTGLKSATTYSITVKACSNSTCSLSGASSPAVGTTAEEYWQLQGTSGATSDAVSRATSDSNTLNYALSYGDWAGDSLRGRIRYYYNPNVASEKGVKTALSTSVASSTVSSLTTFDVLSGYGLVAGTSTAVPASGISTTIGQAIAIPYNGKVRLMVEAQGTDRTNRIYQIDSADGYVGVDFNAGNGTLCSVPNGDLTTSGACAPSIALGLTQDGFTSPGVTAFRQMKLLYPTQTSWVWNGAANTPMIVTMDLNTATAAACAQYKFTQGWALWDGTKWALQYASDGTCPKLFDGMQAPAPVHLGDGRYKLYYSNNVTPSSQQTFNFDNKPVRVIYGSASGSTIAFEDFESMSAAREVNFLWPDGSLMALFTGSTTGGETKLDDYTMLAPTGNLDVQVMYTNFSGGSKGAFTAVAVLLNP